MAKKQRRAAKELAQTELMHGIGNVLGYWHENPVLVERAKELGMTEREFGDLLRAQADRVANLFGFEQAWGN